MQTVKTHVYNELKISWIDAKTIIHKIELKLETMRNFRCLLNNAKQPVWLYFFHLT